MTLALAVVVVVTGRRSGDGWVSGVFLLKFWQAAGMGGGWAGEGNDGLLGFLGIVVYHSRPGGVSGRFGWGGGLKKVWCCCH